MPTKDWNTRYRRYSLIVTVVAAFVNGMVLEVDERLEVLAILAFASGVILWCQLDALVHGKVYQRAFAWLMLWTWPVGILVHLFWTRRWRGLPLYLVLALMQLAAVAAGEGVGTIAARARLDPASVRQPVVPADLD